MATRLPELAGESARLARMVAEFETHGVTDVAYLRQHFGRFVTTKALFEQASGRKGGRLLDVGAHWLHQSYLYARDGYEVTAADLPATLAADGVKGIAAANGIRLLPYDELESGKAFAGIPDDSFDAILFTEVLEHLAFNPVALWRELHRLLSAGGRIVITTPNYNGLRNTLRRWQRHASQPGGGLSVEQILKTPTYGHHWKEYALAEVREYFELLSRDFVLRKAVYVEDYYRSPSRPARAARLVEKVVPFIRPNLHVEVELTRKRHGVTLHPSWE